jgi:isocitrate dehydrogenase
MCSKHGATLTRLGVDPDGVGDMLTRIETLPEAEKAVIKAYQATYAKQPGLAMVNSDRRITNLHVPSDVIIDASMPAMIESGRMWGLTASARRNRRDPRSLLRAAVQAVIEDCKAHGAFDRRRWALCRT